MIEILVKRGLPIAALMIGETYALTNFQELLPEPVQGSSILAVPKLYGLVALFNVVGSTFTLLSLASRVGKARKKYGVEYPKMYAEGDSEDAKAFNQVQRGHQHALETYPSFLALSLIGGLRHPIVTSLCGAVYMCSRLAWADGYAVSAETRYTKSRMAPHIWTCLIGVVYTAVSSSLGILNIL
ncbi:Microsomal glutathione S-transferase 3 [Hondaea fermentalgiana]|uniref:Microsomal glutathione S-transferase 3 n=1 Tax=Hondaea fermentalgiana TaxID=2315210 RepID=A0A2R5H1B8_9STRA|nr:Microsomal glutathione S-transferase 3 [Hondaea fermentalgiana]|eukprot:GBG34591.1 Microsomal glutathione S-transferase 3 [Hondaea fermentalgiana]